MVRSAADINARLLQRLDEMAARLAEIDRRMLDPEVAGDHRAARDLSIQRAALAPICERYAEYRALERQVEEMRHILAADDDADADPDLVALAREELPDLERRAADLLERVKADLVTSDDRAVGSIILELRAGVGGDEAALWTGDLLDMYRRFAASRGWRVEDLEFSPGDAGGFRSAVLSIQGEGVWSELGYEGGTHQVKRVPATEAQGRVHTSTATVAVLPEPPTVEDDLNPADVKVDITTAQGPGGQNVNKVATAVRLVHVPTGMEVRMQESKSQQQNREKAWKLLLARVYELKRQQALKERAEQRVAIIGTGDRAEKIRTYRYKENLVVDHRVNESFNLQDALAGGLDEIVRALIAHDTAQRLAAL